MLSFVLPTLDRPAALERTLARLGALTPSVAAEVIVVDNASREPVCVPARLANGWRALTLRMPSNLGAAARNEGVRLASGEWVILLDDDSAPTDVGFLRAIDEAPSDVAAIGAEIALSVGGRESGGLPEVFVGCGVAIRRAALLAVGGYDAAFQFYAEEYDLCARLLWAGHRIAHDRRFRVLHEKTRDRRDLNLILARLVRNTGWVMHRYAPASELNRSVEDVLTRYREIAEREGASVGYASGLAELSSTLTQQPRMPLAPPLWERFTGRAAARLGLAAARSQLAGRRVAIVCPGKAAETIETIVSSLGATIVHDEDHAESLVVGTLSPGPLLDALDRYASESRPVIAPWTVAPSVAALRHAG